MFASPQLSPEILDTFYEDTFANDHGSRMKAKAGLPVAEKLRKEESLAADWGWKIMQRFIAVQGARILDLRCRSGALSAMLKAAGAEVFCVEPFEANVNYARQVRRLSDVSWVPFSQFDQFSQLYRYEFDAVNLLAHHVLAHVLSPHLLLRKIFEILKPGGYLLLDEKDVLLPARYKTQGVFDSGLAHQYHLTVHTVAHYLRSAGFALVECEIDKQRVSDYRHIRAVARKPETRGAVEERAPQYDGPAVEDILRRLRWLDRTWQMRRAYVKARRKASRFFRRSF